jgi:hypothetical protein
VIHGEIQSLDPQLLLWQPHRCSRTGLDHYALTTPSFLSRGTRQYIKRSSQRVGARFSSETDLDVSGTEYSIEPIESKKIGR